MRVKSALYLLLLVALSSFSGPIKSFKKLDNGVLVELEQKVASDPQYVKLEVIADNIIHVTATPTQEFGDEKSLMVINDGKSSTDWALNENKGGLVLSTKSLQVKVAASTGEVIFQDKAGSTILQEASGSDKAFTPVKFGQEESYQLQQSFKADNEASKTLTIGKRKGEFDGMLQNRTFNVVYVNQNKPKELQFDATPDQVIEYSGKSKSVKLR